MRLCNCCNQVKENVIYREDKTTHIDEYICIDCLTVSDETIKKYIEVIKDSKNQFKKSLVEFYNTNGYLTQKQVKSIKLTKNEELKLYMLEKDFSSIVTIGGYLSEKKQIESIKFLIDNKRTREIRQFYKVTESIKVDELINNYLEEVKVEEVVENKSEEKTNTTKKNGKKIYIYNTHQSEEYQGDKTVMDAATVLAEQLISYGYEVIVETNDFTKYCNEQGLTYNDLYMVSNKFLNDALVKYGGFDLIIDLHRDSVPREYTYVTIDGVSYAKTMMVIGGAAKYAQSSTQISKTITDNVNQIKNGIMKSVFTREGAYYNQYVCEGIVLMECGSENNTFEEVTNSIQVVAKGIHKMMEG